MFSIGKTIKLNFNQNYGVVQRSHIPAVVQLTPEAKCICHPERSFAGLVIYTKFPEYPDMNFIYDITRPDDIFIDVGADIGTYSLVAASKITTGKVYAFEPTPSSLCILNQNIYLNNFGSKIEIVEKLVSDIDATEGFVFCKDSEENHIIYSKGKMAEKGQKVKSVKLDTFAASMGLSYVDLVKIDVEGAEYKVLQGFEGYLATGSVGILLIEVNLKSKLFGLRADDVFSFLLDRGYYIYRFDSSNKLCLFNTKGFQLSRTMNIVAVHKSCESQERINHYNNRSSHACGDNVSE